MIKRFIIAIILLVLVGGGLVGFNMFRDQAMQDFFATMQRPPVAVSTTEVEAVSWEPEIRAIGTVNAANGKLTNRDPARLLFPITKQIKGLGCRGCCRPATCHPRPGPRCPS